MAETHIQIGDISPRIQYTGDGAQTAFTYPFPIFADADMAVYDDTTLKILTTDYTVAGAGNSSGGTVTFVTAPANGVTITLKRNIAIQRISDFQESGEFRSKVINDELDTLTAAMQQVDDGISRSLRLSDTDTATSLTLPDKATRLSKYLGFDASGDPIATDAAGPQGPQGPAGNMDGANNLSELTNAATARTNLGLGTAAVENVAAGGSGDLLRTDGDGSSLTGPTGGATDAEKSNIMLNAFRIAINGGLSVQNMADGVSDEYEDETGVDTANSTNEVYDAAGDFYTNGTLTQISQAAGTAIGNMTNGGNLAASFDSTQHQALTASSRTTGDNIDGEIGKDWGVGVTKKLTQAIVYSTTDGGFHQTPGQTTTITIKGSNTASTGPWTDIGNSGAFTSANSQVITISGLDKSTAYRYHIAHITGMVGANTICSEVEFFETPATDLTLLSNATTALATPTDAFLVLWQEDVDAITLNTDLLGWVTMEAGQAFTTDFATDDKLDIAAHGFANDDRVMVTSSAQALPAGLDSATVYYVVNAAANDFELSLTSSGAAVDITDDGTGTHTARRWKQATLAEASSLTTGRVLTSSITLSGLTAGTAMRYAIQSLNTKGQNFHAVGLQWS